MEVRFDASLVYVCELGVRGCARFGFDELRAALRKRGVELRSVNHWTQMEKPAPLLVVGTTENRRIQMMLESAGVDYRLGPESLFVKWCGIPGSRALVLAGTDDAGLMYNLLETARKAETLGAAALNGAVDLTESPQNKVRCVDRYLLGHLDDEWFKSEEFWRYLLERMARARFNRFCLILGFDTAYMSPPYPFFVESSRYPGVAVRNLSAAARAENLSALRRIGDMCHRYGMKFVFATWQQRPWTRRRISSLRAARRRGGTERLLLPRNQDPGIRGAEIDVVQFRVNHESGVGTQVSAEAFWKRCSDAVADVAAERGGPSSWTYGPRA
jgi:hypothetical protein